MAKEKSTTKKVKEEVVTDILESYFMEDGVEMVKRTYMNGDKLVREEVKINR